MLDLVLIGSRIAELRKQAGFTQNGLAETLYVTHQAVSKWENGKSIPSIEILYELTKLFHVSIDYVLDNTEIDENNYDKLFSNLPRDVVITKFLRSENPAKTIDQVFYRLSKQERMKIINHLIYNNDTLQVPDVWPYLNKTERTYLLGTIATGTCDFNINRIITQLSTEEQLMMQKHYHEGTYPYQIHQIHYTK